MARARSAPVKPIVARLSRGWKRHADPAWLANWRPEPFELPDGTTSVVAMGEGPPLALIPPLPGFKESWLACAGLFARRHRVITFDLRVRFQGEPSWEPLLEDLERVLDAYAPGPIAVLGHSLGGALAQRWTLLRPQRVRALVLSSSFARVFTPRGHWGSRYVEQPLVLAGQRLLPRRAALSIARHLAAREAWVYDRRCDDRVLDFVRFCIRDVPLSVARTAMDLAWRHDTRASLPGLSCPTLLIVGERESSFARQAVTELASLVPGAELRESPGVGHLHPFSGAVWLAETVGAWLEPPFGAGG